MLNRNTTDQDKELGRLGLQVAGLSVVAAFGLTAVILANLSSECTDIEGKTKTQTPTIEQKQVQGLCKILHL